MTETLINPMPAVEPETYVRFDPSQSRFFRDTSRVIVVNWHRQKGKDFTAAAKAVDQAMATGQDWFIVSLTQRQADATFAKCRKIFAAFKSQLKLQGQATLSEWEYLEYDKWIDEHFVSKARELLLPNGARVVSLPGRDPDTLTGLTGNVIFTEFGLFPGGGYEHWRNVFPLCTRGFSVVVISTPRGKNTKFFELFNDPQTYSVHFCDIYRSIAEDGFVLEDNHGQPCALDEFKKLYGDPIGFDREYGCQFTGDLQALLTWAQLIQAAAMGKGLPFDLLRMNGEGGWEADWFRKRTIGAGRLEMGWDVARRADLAALWVNHAPPGRPRYPRYLVIMDRVSFDLQNKVIRAAMDAKGWGSGVGCGDETGMGIESNERLHVQYGDRWEPVNFASKKSDLGKGAQAAFRDGTQAIPPIDGPYKFIATDLYAIQRVTGDSLGEVKAEEPKEAKLKLSESENPLLPQSHCDIGYAGFLAIRAGTINWQAPLLASRPRKPVGW